MEEKVDFILIAGDLFHANIPDMYVTNEAVKKMKEVKDAEIPIYVIYGSHDYSPNETSIIDILNSAGLIKKIVKGEVVGDKLQLAFFKDSKTGAKLVGISGRKLGLEKNYFEILDRECLEKEKGFKIFALHSGLSELKPEYMAQVESIPVSLLPKGFDYYAGGHIHQCFETKLPEYGRIVYPGTLFAGSSTDIEDSAKGQRRGLYIVDFEEKVENVQFREISVCKFAYIEYDVSNKNSLLVMKGLGEKLQEAQVQDALVVVKVKGELSGGKTSDISSTEIKTLLMDNGALGVIVNRHGLSSKEYTAVRVMGEDIPTIETRLLKENIGAIKVSNEDLKGDKGVKLAEELLKALRQEQKINETKRDYLERVQRQALDMLGLREELT
jgi:DNA repair exonuclease SbcCD nuclease subunit